MEKKWNGKWKKYKYCKLRFVYEKSLELEGEYINGKIKGKEYDKDGDLIFEGVFLNEEKNGQGKEYQYNEIVFTGEYLNGKRNGKGKEYYHESLIFEGEYLNGERNGKGKEYWEGILIFKGEYINGERGKGKEFDSYY